VVIQEIIGGLKDWKGQAVTPLKSFFIRKICGQEQILLADMDFIR
jgi:hypothetical protein